jgi:GNAT superfamily N-acetyltransferase
VCVSIAAEPIDSTDAARMIGELDAELTSRYPPEQNFLDLPAADVSDGHVVFLIVRLDGVAVGCGALRRLSRTSAEIKRMYVSPAARGRGLARRLLAELEARALELGCATLVLETGDGQTEALGLYESAGYSPMPCFGAYAGSPSSVCFKKELDPV